MTKILLHGLSIESAEQIRTKLDLHLKDIELYTSTDIEKTKDIVTERALNLFIFETHNYTKKESSILKDFKLWGLSFPVLVICENVMTSDVESIRNDNKPIFLESKFEDKKLIGLIKKLLRTRQIPQQMYVRYPTNQRVMVESISEGRSIDSSMYNLSKGGAYCEFDPEDLDFAVGDVVRISV